MGIGVSLILIAAGAILTWAIHVSSSGFNIHTIGIILMVGHAREARVPVRREQPQGVPALSAP